MEWPYSYCITCISTLNKDYLLINAPLGNVAWYSEWDRDVSNATLNVSLLVKDEMKELCLEKNKT